MQQKQPWPKLHAQLEIEKQRTWEKAGEAAEKITKMLYVFMGALLFLVVFLSVRR